MSEEAIASVLLTLLNKFKDAKCEACNIRCAAPLCYLFLKVVICSDQNSSLLSNLGIESSEKSLDTVSLAERCGLLSIEHVLGLGVRLTGMSSSRLLLEANDDNRTNHDHLCWPELELVELWSTATGSPGSLASVPRRF